MLARTTFETRSVCLVLLTMLAVFYTLYVAASLILPVVLALVLMLLLAPAMRLLTRRLHLPRIVAALLLILVLGFGVAGLVMAVEPQVAGWISAAPQELPKLQQSLSGLRGPLQRLQAGLEQLQGAGGGKPSGSQPASPGLASFAPVGGAVLSGTRALVGQGFTLLLVLFFLLTSGESLLHRFVEVLPSFADKKRALQITRQVEENISKYLATITVMNALVGLINGLQAWLVGLPGPLLWGLVAFGLNYIPILGPFTGVALFFVAGAVTLPSLWYALLTAAIYLAVHVLEGETITPMLLARRFTLNPLMVMLSLVLWDWVWGVPGAFLSVPLLAVFKIVCDHVEMLTPLGHVLGSDHARPKRR